MENQYRRWIAVVRAIRTRIEVARCCWCHRKLKNPKYIEQKCGKVCAAKHGVPLTIKQAIDQAETAGV